MCDYPGYTRAASRAICSINPMEGPIRKRILETKIKAKPKTLTNNQPDRNRNLKINFCAHHNDRHLIK